MTLGELLEELREGILRDRSDQVAGAQTDQLWSDKQLIRYINEAQNRFAKESECLRDATTPEVCQVTSVVGTDRYALNPKVIGVLSARVAGDKADLARAGHANLDTYRVVDNRWFDTSHIFANTPGKTLAFSTDEGMLEGEHNSLSAMCLRLYPNVGDGYAATINLRVVRFPLRRLRADNLDAVPEIPEEHHLNMLDWAGYLALRGPDLDVAGGDAPKRARDLAASFKAHTDDMKRELKRRLFAPAAFQFGQNGFTYERDWIG